MRIFKKKTHALFTECNDINDFYHCTYLADGSAGGNKDRRIKTKE